MASQFDVDLEVGGKPVTVTVQANSAKEAQDFVTQHASTPAGAQQVLSMASDGAPEDTRGVLRKAWDALTVPEKMSKDGLTQIAAAVPEGAHSGNLAKDLVTGTPKVAAETLAEAAPGFVSRGSILTSGALAGLKMAAPLIKAAGGQVAKGLEGISGLEYKNPGILTEAANDPGLITAPGKRAAGVLYESALNPGSIRPEFASATSNDELLKMAMKAGTDGNLTPEEALVARQTLDKMQKNLPDYSYREMRKAFDAIAKNVTTDADAAYSRGVKADALRQLFPQNKLGGTSIAKGILGLLGGGGPLLAMSPIAQGAAATATGQLARTGSAIAGPTARTAMNSGSMIGELLDMAQKFGAGRK